VKFPLVVALAFVALPLTSVHALETTNPAEPPTDPEPWIADFEGIDIDLRDGWDGARACLTDGVTTECWDTEAEMLAAVGATTPTVAGFAGGSGFRRASCSSFLRLYTGTNFTGTVLGFSTQYTFLNLSGYGFNNVTSSYRMGGCPAAFYDLSNGGNPLYGGNTSPWATASSMLAGWDNRISSIYIG